jgi:DNA-binding PadR family transcriptional regulator
MATRMQEPTYLILAALASGPQHGYGIMKEAEQLSGGTRRLQAGTLYAALERLTGEGLLTTDREEVVDARFRRYYRLTDDGVAQLTEETARRRSQAHVVTQRLRAAGLLARAVDVLTHPSTPPAIQATS